MGLRQNDFNVYAYRVRTTDAGVAVSAGRVAWALAQPERPAWPTLTGDERASTAVCRAIAAVGKVEVLRWARANGCDWGSGTCAAAAGGGHLEVLQWARANGCDWDSEVISSADGSGHTAVAEWARANGCLEPSSEEEQSDDY